jgi:hypothetical protein
MYPSTRFYETSPKTFYSEKILQKDLKCLILTGVYKYPLKFTKPKEMSRYTKSWITEFDVCRESWTVCLGHALPKKTQNSEKVFRIVLHSPLTEVSSRSQSDQIGRKLLWASIRKLQKYPTFIGYLISRLSLFINLTKNELGYILGNFFTNSSGHTDAGVVAANQLKQLSNLHRTRFCWVILRDLKLQIKCSRWQFLSPFSTSFHIYCQRVADCNCQVRHFTDFVLLHKI